MNEMRRRYNLRHIDVLRLFIPAKLREERDPEFKRIYLTAAEGLDDEAVAVALKRAPRQREALEHLKTRGGEYLSVLSEMFGAGAVNGLREKGFAEESAVHDVRTPLEELKREHKRVTLTEDQQRAVDSIMSGKGVYLLHGVTGCRRSRSHRRSSVSSAPVSATRSRSCTRD